MVCMCTQITYKHGPHRPANLPVKSTGIFTELQSVTKDDVSLTARCINLLYLFYTLPVHTKCKMLSDQAHNGC